MDDCTAYTGPDTPSDFDNSARAALKNKQLEITMATLSIDRIINLLQSCEALKAEKDYLSADRVMFINNELARLHKTLQDICIDIYGHSGESRIIDKDILNDPKSRRSALVFITESLYIELRKLTEAIRRLVSN